MTDPGPTPEPSNADLLAFMQQAFAHLTTELSGVKADVASVKEDVATVKTDVAGVKRDVASVKSDTTEIHRYVGDLQDRLHGHFADPDAHGRAA